ncbi:hypothetical protein J4229_02525 [Candidatus Pacearchaeota archaeon]|nr:hypothetical protein [Candidatus Pacearchaeota archaeon]
MKNEKSKMKGGNTDYEIIIQYVIIGILAILIVYNASKIYGVSANAVAGTSQGQTLSSFEEYSYVIPTGTPEIYGEELGVKYDDVSTSNPSLADETISKLSAYEDETLTSAQMERYIKIGSSISCEYCCGAKALVFSNGERACGCAHSYAMRGLAKYLLIKHSDMADLEILNELGKWKVLFFPGVHEKKASVLKANGIDETDYINLASNLYRGAENQATTSSSGAGSQMVGGC